MTRRNFFAAMLAPLIALALPFRAKATDYVEVWEYWERGMDGPLYVQRRGEPTHSNGYEIIRPRPLLIPLPDSD